MTDNTPTVKTTTSFIDQVKAQAQHEINKELSEKAVKLMKSKYKELKAAKTIVANLERELLDLEARINDGNF